MLTYVADIKLMFRAPKKLLLFLLIFSHSAQSDINDYIYPYSNPSYSNYGTLGLLQMPSARMHEEGTLGFSWSNNDPYLRGSLIAYPFSWFEASYQYTDVNNALYSNVESFSGNQTYKDKSFDAKFRILKESELLPQIAIGFRDIAGSGIFSAEYIVASKFYKNFDFTFGMGWGALSETKIKNPFTYISDSFETRTLNKDTMGGELSPGKYFSGPTGLFGGVEIFLPNVHGLRLKIEYDGTDYSEEGFRPGYGNYELAFKPQRPASSKVNFGVVYPISNSIQLKAGYTKGNTFNFGFSIALGFKDKDPVIKKNDPYTPIKNAAAYKQVSEGNKNFIYRTALTVLNEKRLYLQAATLEDESLSVAYSQGKHSSYIRASGRVARALNETMPDEVKEFKLTTTNASMGMHEIIIDRESFNRHIDDELYQLTQRNIQLNSATFIKEEFDFKPSSKLPTHYWKISPSIRSQIGGPDGFYFGDLRLSLHSELILRPNFTIVSNGSIGIYNTFDDLKLASDSVLPHVRTEIVNYLKESEKYNIQTLQFNWFNNFSDDIYSKISGGILEGMFGGIGGELLYRPFTKNYAVGAELWHVQQRDYDQMFSFRDYKTLTGHVTFYLTEPKSQVLFLLKGGRFLAKDSGIKIDISRRFQSGMRAGIFFAKTDISEFEFGEGSFDKGFYFWLPIEAFFSNYSRGHAGFGLRPVTRDGAAVLNHSHNLYSVTEAAHQINLTRDWSDIYD